MISKLYRDHNTDHTRSIIVAGTARSGTTWLAEMMAYQLKARLIFEPFHPGKIKKYQNFNYFQYVRPAAQKPELEEFCNEIFSGRIRNAWIDRQVNYIFPRYRIVKDIRANLLLKWITDRYPQIPVVLLLRHPCAVVSSRLNLNWATDTDISSFLLQPELIEDFLSDKLEFIKSLQTPEEKHAAIWCLSYYVPLKQFSPDQIKSVYYERLCTDHERVLQDIFDYFQLSTTKNFNKKMLRPSSTFSKHSGNISKIGSVDSWKNQLSEIQIKNVMEVVKFFDMNKYYGEDRN
jgi:hypothetical protein